MFEWRFLDRSGSATGSSAVMADRAVAEEWLAERWQELSLDGVWSVELVETATGLVVYRMSLAEE